MWHVILNNIICSSSGRKSVARVLCLLRNIRTRLKDCGEGGLDVATEATINVALTEAVDSARVIPEKTDVSLPTPNVQTTSLSSVNIKSGNTVTTNITSGPNLIQQRKLNDKAVFASLATTAGEMLLRK